jgi:hypothetical protein
MPIRVRVRVRCCMPIRVRVRVRVRCCMPTRVRVRVRVGGLGVICL